MCAPKWFALVFAVGLLPACGKESSGDEARAANPTPARASPAEKAPAAPGAGGPKTLEMPLGKDALPTGKLEAAPFIVDPCAAASAKEIGSYLSFIESEVEPSKGERRDRGQCLYEASEPETRLEVWFDAGKQLRSSESKISLGGLDGVTLRVLDESAELTIPFEAAKNATKMPADRIFVHLELYHSNRIPTWDAAYRKPDPKALEAAVRGIGANLIERLGLGT